MRVVFAISLISASVIALPTAPSAHADPPAPIPEPILPPLAPGQVIRIGPTAGTGTPTRDYDIGATDLCEFMEFPSGILQVCGDSFAGQGVGFGPWHSPIALHVETESIDDQTGVRYDRVTGNDKPLLADPTPAGMSQLPAGVVQINRDNYLLVTTVKDLVPQTSRLVKANPAQGNWPTVPNSQRHGRLRGRAAVADQRLLRPDPDAGFAERLGVHRRQQLRPQRTGGAVPGQTARHSPTAPVGRGGLLRPGGVSRRRRCGRTELAR